MLNLGGSPAPSSRPFRLARVPSAWDKISCRLISHNMGDFWTLEVFLKFADFYAVSVHGLLGAVPILVDLVDDH